jgi:hypothetical protein
MLYKKGFEKAIEVFIILFIVIVASTVVLRMFKSEVADKTSDLGDLKRQELTAQSIQKAKTTCSQLCADAARDGCSLQSLTAFCGHNVGPLDLDNDNGFRSYDDNLLGGVGVCEEKIVCPLLIDCTCSKRLSIGNCIETMCEYWTALRDDGASIVPNTKLANIYGSSSCIDKSGATVSSDWNPSTLTCS